MACGGCRCSSVVVWQWQDQHDWKIYSATVSNFLEESLVRGKTRVSIGDACRDLSSYVVDLIKMKQRNKTTGYQRDVRRVVLGGTSVLANGFAWEWLGDSAWQFYTLSAMDLLERGHSAADSIVDLGAHPLRLPYQVDLKHLKQINTHTNFCRPVRRQRLAIAYREGSDTASPLRKRSLLARILKRQNKDTGSSEMGCVSSDFGSLDLPILPNIVEPSGQPTGDPFRNISNFCDQVDLDEEDKVVECPICTEQLSDPSTCEFSSMTAVDLTLVFSLKHCKHRFHAACLKAMREACRELCLRCPICKAIHGVHTGNQPEGRMTVKQLVGAVPGYEGHDTLRVKYDVFPGIQGPEHPHPGRPFSCHNFPRRTYFPDNEEGREIVAMLRVAWERRLIFTVGRSATSGTEDTVTWNEIHHKTRWQDNDNGHGWPDPNYLFNVREELKEQGVTGDDVLLEHRRLG